MKSRVSAVLAVVAAAAPVVAELNVGSDGSDGAFSPPSGGTFVVDLSKAVTGTWDMPSDDADNDGYGDGVYDPILWAIVFKYDSINIPANTTVTFRNHPANPPVVWLVDTTAVINGIVVLDGGAGHLSTGFGTLSIPGPGGFPGGRGMPSQTAPVIDTSCDGFGPGGGRRALALGQNGSGGSFGTAGTGPAAGNVYGSSNLRPLIGGSGGGGGRRTDHGGGGGAGGGAVLIAVDQTLTLGASSRISARGGSGNDGNTDGGGGSGGGIRLLADRLVLGSAQPTSVHLLTTEGGGSGGGGFGGAFGRIRVEANETEGILNSTPVTAIVAPEPVWPEPTTPSIRPISLGGFPISATPSGGLAFPFVDIIGRFVGTQALILQSANIPVNATIVVRVAPTVGGSTTYPVVNQGPGNPDLWQADINVANGVSLIDIVVTLP